MSVEHMRVNGKIRKELARIAGLDSVDTKEVGWQLLYSWSTEEKGEFIAYLFKCLKVSPNFREFICSRPSQNPTYLFECAEAFANEYGWFDQ